MSWPVDYIWGKRDHSDVMDHSAIALNSERLRFLLPLFLIFSLIPLLRGEGAVVCETSQSFVDRKRSVEHRDHTVSRLLTHPRLCFCLLRLARVFEGNRQTDRHGENRMEGTAYAVNNFIIFVLAEVPNC